MGRGESAMKVLIANGGFFPAQNYGGPVVSIDNLCSLLCDTINFYVVCLNHDLGSKEVLTGIAEGWNERQNCKVKYFREKDVSYHSLEKVVNEIEPDTIYINSLFDALWTIPLLKLAKKYSIRVLLAPRGQICKNAFSGKYKKIPYINYLKLMGLLKDVYFQSTSDEETECIVKYLGDKERIFKLTNLPSVPPNSLSHNEKVSGIASFVFYSRIVKKKNLISAIKYFKEVKGKVTFDIYGPIEDVEYWKTCQNEISKLPDNIEVSYRGTIRHEAVFELLSRYDAFIFPTWSENYGHVIAEALFSGCPVIISDQTPWNDVLKENAGWALCLDNTKMFVDTIQCVIDMDDELLTKMRKSSRDYIESHYDIETLKNNYNKALSES